MFYDDNKSNDVNDNNIKQSVSINKEGGTKVIDAITGEILISNCNKFNNFNQNDNNFILINDKGIQLNTLNYLTSNSNIIFVYQQRMFTSDNDDLINDSLNHILDPLPNLIKPVKPLDTTNISLKGWLLALEDDVNNYYKEVILKFNNNYDRFFDVLDNLICYLDNFQERNVKYDTNQIDINEMYIFDYDNVISNLKNINIDENSSLVNFIDLNKFDSFYLKFKDLRYKIFRFVNDIVNDQYRKLRNSHQKIQTTHLSLKEDIKKNLETSLEFDIDTLMFEKFEIIIKKILEEEETSTNNVANNFTGQINTLYTIANSLFAKSNEILIMKRNIQSSIIKFISNEITNHQIKIVNFKNLLNKDLNENMGFLTVKYESLLFLQYDLPLMYGSNLVELYRRKVLFKLKYLLKFDNLVIKKNPWLDEDLESEINTRNEYLANFNKLDEIKFINFKQFNNKFHIKHTFIDIRNLKKHINLGEDPEEDIDDMNDKKYKMDKEANAIINYCQNLEKCGLNNLSDELLKNFESMKKETLNQSQSFIADVHQEDIQESDLISSLQTKVDTLKSKLILQDLFDIEDWPIKFDHKQIETMATDTKIDEKEDNTNTINFLMKELDKKNLENQQLKTNLEEHIINFKHDFNNNSKINEKLLAENESLKKINNKLTNSNTILTQRIKAGLYKDISLLEKIGLLLDAKEMKINRVKGLKKPNSNMLESTISLTNDINLTESVVVKADVSPLTQIQQDKDLLAFDDHFKQVYIKSRINN
ncbi:hypothetical protein HANVADRAFT_2511 [Hanseniaspora valbyensis NRRL Y-1626]|uniref:Autophagy-related protein 11 n=1 Tax=Hanseniaspora valbyensis NRRL Y-1626 TaxID=766949 RepID=A0A1B7TD61_9ASCO|nr:hypothetical protein HANVADRAFT_2511 [Hanseniaspora valbyensis NRRL Y-1626]